MKFCSFFGHSNIEITEKLKLMLTVAIEILISQGVDTFYFGGFGKFDDLCWQIVSDLKKTKYLNIKRIFCLSDPRQQNPLKRPKWINNDDYEDIIYFELDFDYWYQRIYFRNCEIIKHSDYTIFYINHQSNSGAYKAMKYAKKIKKPFINLAI